MRANAPAATDDTEPVAPGMLLQACAKGNRLAFEALYRATSATLFGICLHYLNNRAEAEEVLQEVFTTVWLKAVSFDPNLAGAMTWLATIARHKAIDRCRVRRHHAHESLETVSEWPLRSSVETTVEQERQGQQLDHCLAALDEDQQRYIRVAFFEGYTYAELAARHSIPLGTLKSRIRRGLLQLKACLGL